MSPFSNIRVPTHIHLCLRPLAHREQGRGCSASEATTPLLLGKSGRNSTSSTHTSLPPHWARKSHRPFNSGINDQQERPPLKYSIWTYRSIYRQRLGAEEGGREKCRGQGAKAKRNEVWEGESTDKNKEFKTERADKD